MMFRRNGGQPQAKAFKRVMPQTFARERIETKDFAGAGGKHRLVFQNDVDKTRAFEMRHPHLLACATIQRDDRSFDADEYQL